MSNSYRDLLELLPQAPLQVATVLAVDGGIATLELPGGGILRARGAASVDQTVFVRDNVIESVAPTLPLVTIEI